MSELERRSKPTIEKEDTKRVDELFNTIDRTVLDPHLRRSIADPVEAALYNVVLPELLQGGGLRPHIEEAFALRRINQSYFPNWYALRIVTLSVDNQMKELFPDSYPQYYTTPALWQKNDVFGRLDYVKLIRDIQRNQAYNLPQSYAFFDILTRQLRNHWDRPPVVVDTGDAQGLGGKKWMLQKKYPFKPIKVYLHPAWDEPIGSDLEPDLEAQTHIDSLTQQVAVVDQVLGYDISPIAPDDIDTQQWCFSNTFAMMEERRDPRMVQEFRDLVDERPQDVHVVNLPIDATNPDDLARLGELLPGGKADFFTLSGVLLQLPPQKIYEVFRNLRPYASESALYSVNEWARVDNREPSGLKIIPERWWDRRGTFGNFLIDPNHLDRPPIPVGFFLNRRGEEMMLTEEGRQLFLNKAYL